MGVSLLLSCGCPKVGPDYAPPSAPLAASWISGGEPLSWSRGGDPASWWAKFGDPVLHELVARAYAGNPSVRAAGFRVLEARARRGIAVGGILPQQGELGGSFRHVDTSASTANQFAGIDTSFGEWKLGFDAAWELDLWGRFRREIEAADARVLEAEASRDAVLVSLVGEVAANYVQLRTLEERLEVARKNAELEERGYRIADARYLSGAVTALDAAQAGSLLADTRARVPALETSIRQTKTTLSILLGLPPADLAEELGDPRPIPGVPAEVAVVVPAELLRRRPDLRAAERALAVQSAEIGIAAADLYPHFSLTGHVGLAAAEAGDLGDARAVEHFGGPSFRWEILDYLQLTNNVRAQEARYQAQLAEYQATVLRAQAETENAMASFLGARRRVAELQRSVEEAARAAHLAELQYREGAVDFTRVLDTHELLLNAQDQVASTRGEVALALTSLYKSLGGGWETPERGGDSAARELRPPPAEASTDGDASGSWTWWPHW